MCGRYVLGDLSWKTYFELLSIVRSEDSPSDPRYNIAPTQDVPILIPEGDTLIQADSRWGLIPDWFRDDVSAFKQTTFNARIETADEKPTFRASWTAKRCLVPASGWYEWTGDDGAKVPWFVDVIRNTEIFFFAGLYARRLDGLLSHTILTRPAAPEIAHLHPRMPVVLRDDQLQAWTGPTPPEKDALGPWVEGRLSFHRVGPIRGDDVSLIEPFEEPEPIADPQPGLFD